MHELPRPQRWRLHALPKIQKIWELNHEMLVSRSRMPLSIVTGILVLTSDPPKEDFFSQYNKDGPYQERALLVPYHLRVKSTPDMSLRKHQKERSHSEIQTQT